MVAFETLDRFSAVRLTFVIADSEMRKLEHPAHLIGSSKWCVSAEGYNHLLGFYESFDGGKTWPIQGHIPGYEGWTDNTDPVGAFDGFGNFYELVLAYQFFYNADGTHNLQTNPNREPNPAVPAGQAPGSYSPTTTAPMSGSCSSALPTSVATSSAAMISRRRTNGGAKQQAVLEPTATGKV